MTRSQLHLMMAESGLSHDDADELAELLAPLAALPDAAAPVPSAELMHLFDSAAPDGDSSAGRPSLEQRRGSRARSTIAGVVVLAMSGVGATGMSAAANTLPSSWQHQVADFSRHYLPFDFPEPATRAKGPTSRAPDARRDVRRGVDTFNERRGEATEATRSTLRDELVAKGAPSAPGRGPRSNHATPDDRGQLAPGYSVPWSQPQAAPVAGETPSAAVSGSGQGSHGTDDDRDRSEAPDTTDRDRRGETGKKNDDDNNDHSEQSDRPVRGGGVGGPKEGQKGPQKGPQKGTQPGQPGGGGSQGEPGKGKPGDDAGPGGGPQEPPSQPEPDDRGPADQGPPEGKDDPPGPVGDTLSRLVQDAEGLLGG